MSSASSPSDKDNFEGNRNSHSEMEQKVKSRAVVKYSAVQVPSNFARLQCNTDLNLPPSNWLTSSAESYGLQHVLSKSTGFSSFRMAHMFPDCMGEVDVVSDAENIKKLLKIPYSRDAVSMMVHCIEKTLLIDEFDIHKHLLRTSESDWEWLRKFFFEQVLQTLSEKNAGVSAKHKSRQALQQRALVSKFLHYSLAETDTAGQSQEEQTPEHVEEEETLAKKWPPLPEPRLEEELPDPATDHTFNRNVVWTFEDIQMLLGTDLPIFGGNTHPCISLRLRDMAKPISVLTGIDYWLDNLMCNVPEVVMCYHLDGIVQRYELVKTEDLPYMADSKFSPNLIRDVAQNILSFLKSNATKAGHTYWLFKGKDEDVVKLYDLTSLCSEGLLEQGQNPFTVPVAMLLYRVARNMKHSSDPSQQPGTIRALLNNCLFLLPKEKYPQIVTSAHYMLSDLYLPLGVDPLCLQDETVSPEPPAEEEEHKSSPIKSLCISDHPEPPPLPPYVPPPPLVGTMTERCQQALEHVVAGLQCLQYFEIAPNLDDVKAKKSEQQETNTDQPKMAQPSQPIPMPYSSLTPEKPKENDKEKLLTTKKKNKKKKHTKQQSEKVKEKEKERQSYPDVEETEEGNCLEHFPVYSWNSNKKALLSKPQAMALPTWQAPETMDNASWKGHLKTLLYEKACLVYNTLAETEYSAKRYGASLRCVGLVLRCHAHMARGCGRCTSLVSGMLGRAGDNCFHLTQDWPNIESHRTDFLATSDTDKALEVEMAVDMPNSDYPYECIITPKSLESVEQLLLSSVSCYQQALTLKPSDALRCRLGNVHNELSVIYMNKITLMDMQVEDQAKLKAQLDTLFNLAQHHLDRGQEEFARVGHSYNLALLLSNAGRLMRMQALYRSCPSKPGLQASERVYYNVAISLYKKGLGVLGNRKSGPQVWDVIMWELSTTLYTMATLYQDNPPAITDKSQEEVERELIELLTKALQSCDLETTDFRQCMYQFRAAMLHYRLGSLYQHMFRTKSLDDSKRKNVLRLVNLHYDKSALLMQGLEHPLEYLRLQIERVALQEFIAENSSPTGKLKALQTALDFLIRCRPVMESIVERQKTEERQAAKQGNHGERSAETLSFQEEENLLTLFESRIQFVLKSLVKLSISSTNQKISSLASQFKEMYSLVLKQKKSVTLATHLCSAVNAISDLR